MVILLFVWFNWKVLKTENFTMIYPPDYHWEACQILYNLEFYKDEVWQLTGNRYRNLPVVVEDCGMMTNGFADPIFRSVHILTYPPNPGIEIDATRNWYRTVSIHEYTHICHLTNRSGLAVPLNFLFGSIFLPNLYSPPWVFEGITVVSESRFPFEGRLNDGLFDAYIGAIKGNFYPLIRITYTPHEFPYTMGPYLYGGQFFDYLREIYGEERITKFFKGHGSNLLTPIGMIFPALGIDYSAYQAFGCNFPRLYQDWQKNVDAEFKDYKMPGRRLTEDGWYRSYLTVHNGKLYYFRYLSQKVDGNKIRPVYDIVAYNPETEKEKAIVHLNRPVTAPLRFCGEHLYYTVQNLRFGRPNVYLRRYGLTATLYRYHLRKEKNEKVLTDDIRAFTVLPDHKIVYSKDQRHGFGSELWEYKNGEKKMKFDSDILIGEIISKDDRIYITGRKDWETWNIYKLEPGGRLKLLVKSPWVLANLNIIGDRLYFTGNLDRRYRIYSYDLKSKANFRLTKEGYANFGTVLNDSLYFIGLNQKGFDLYVMGASPEPFEFPPEPLIPPKPEVEAMPIDTSRGSYFDVFKTLFLPPLRFPVIFPVDTTYRKFLLGGIIIGGDVTGENTYAVFLAHDGLGDSVVGYGLFTSYIFAPLGLNAEFFLNQYGVISASYPLLLKTDPGLNQILFTLKGRSFDGYRRRELIPVLRFRLGWPDHIIRTEFGLHIEKDRIAPEVEVASNLYTLGGVFSFDLEGFHDPDNPDSITIRIRGEKFRGKSGTKLSLEFSRPIVKIRWGLWNPNLFFEDICGGVFTDFARTETETIYSAGAILKLETGLALGLLKFAPRIGIAITNKKKVRAFFAL